MPVYYNQGPQQYAMHQQNRRDDMIRQLLQLFLMKKQEKREDKRWGEQQELSERRTGAYEQQVETQRKQLEKPGKPSAFYEKFMTAYQLTGDANKAYRMATNPTYKPPKTLERIEAEKEAGARGAGTGKFAPQKTSETIRAESAARAEGAGTGKFKAPTEPTVTPTSKLATRRQISSQVNKLFAEIQTDQPKDFQDPEQIEAYRLRAEVDIDMPPKYTKIKRYMEQDVAKPEEIEYFNKATKTKAWLDKHPEILTIADIGADALTKLDRSIVQSILELRKKPGKNIFQKLGL